MKARAKLGARLVTSPRSASAVDQIACGRRKGQRPIADEVNKLGRFDAEIHMRTSVSALAELVVRIHSPPAESQQTFGSARDFRGQQEAVIPAGLLLDVRTTLTTPRPDGGPKAVDAAGVDDVALLGVLQHRQKRAGAVVDAAPADVESALPFVAATATITPWGAQLITHTKLA